MSDVSETFFTSVGCMDGRVQDSVAQYGREKFGAKYPDTITEAGLVGLIAAEDKPKLTEAVRKKIMISLEKHHSKGIVIHGHQDCAGNPVDDRKHKEDIRKTAKIFGNLVPEGTQIIPVFVVRKEGEWVVEALD